MQNNSSTAICW